MRVLWLLNMMLPDVAKALNFGTSLSGGWLVDYANKLSADPEIELATMTYANVDKDYDIVVGNIRNFVFTGGGKRLLFNSKQTIEDCRKVVEEFKPDLIHIHGTEYAIGYSMIKTGITTPMLLTIQGILTRISEEYYGGLPLREVLKMGGLKDWLSLKTPFFSKQLYKKNAKREQFVLRNVKYVTGRTLWDKAVMQNINENLEYFCLNYNLRGEFYDAKLWNYDEMIPRTIFTGSASYSLKGLHVLLHAIALVKKKYPDVKLVIPGRDITKLKKLNGYEKYIKKLIARLDIGQNIEYVGGLNATGMIEKLQKANLCIIPSAIEGASATMREAMMIGTPGICAFRGGMTSLLRDGDSGFYYDFSEYPVLAERIIELFESRELCEQFSRNARKDAEIMHAREKNYMELKSVYYRVAENS